MSSRTRRPRAFTIVELMITVAIVGVLATLAIYGVQKYVRYTKTAEMRNSLGMIAQLASAAYDRDTMPDTVLAQGGTAALSHQFCGSATQPVPLAVFQVEGKKYQSRPSDWSPPFDLAPVLRGFPCLKFTMDQPQYYQYWYLGFANVAYMAWAMGDLNGDGFIGWYWIEGLVVNGVVNVTVEPVVAIEER